MTTSLRQTIDYTTRFSTHPQKAELYAMLDAANGASTILRGWFMKAEASENPDSILATKVKDGLFAEFGFRNAMTLADSESEQHIIAKLKACKDIPIVAEESGHSHDDASLPNGSQRWLVDPLDGTFCFINGSKDFSITIALQRKVGGKWVTELGLVANPMNDTVYVADQKNSYAIQHGWEKELHIHSAKSHAFDGGIDRELKDKKIDVCIYDPKEPRMQDTQSKVLDHLKKLNSTIRAFSTALMTARMADGYLDGVIICGRGAHQYAWDTDAAIHIAQKAGAKYKRFEMDGQPCVLLANSDALLHAMHATVISHYKSTAPTTGRAAA